MKILTRYILTHFLMIFLAALTLMTSVVVLYVISEATVKKGLPLYLAVRLIPCSMPYLLSITMPVASLLGATLFYAKMVGSNEMIAVKAMGTPLWKAFLPVWITTFLLSLLTIWCNDLAFSWGRRETTKVVISGTEEMILGKLASDGKFADPQNNVVMSVDSVSKDGEMKQVSFEMNNPPFKGKAASGHLEVDFNATPPILRIELNDLLAETNGATMIQRGKTIQDIPLDQLNLGGFSTGDPAMKDVKRVLAEIRREQEKVSRQAAAKSVFALVKGDFGEWQKPEWRERCDYENYLQYKYNRARLATPRSIAAGFTCFFFTWVGIPLAVWLNCSDYFTSFFASFLPTLVVYYPLLMFGYSTAKSGLMPPWICWSGNLVLGLIGFWILKKIHKH